MTHWYVIHSKPRKELFLYQQLCTNNINTFIPLVYHGNKRSPKSRLINFYPGYLFVHVDIEEFGLSNLLWIPGSQGVVCFGGEPADVPDILIDQLKEKITEINKSPQERKCRFSKGEKVTITTGPFKGYQAVFDEYLSDKDRVRLFMKTIADFHYHIEIPELDLDLAS